jgi:hypothetical protein
MTLIKESLHVSLPCSSLPQAQDITHEHAHTDRHSASSNASERARSNHFAHSPRKSAQCRADAEDDVCEEKTLPASEDVAEFAVQRLQCR